MDYDALAGLGLLGSGIGALGSVAQGFMNYGLQTANLDYQKQLQEKIFQREDTALQRRMADAKAAGLNPYSVINSGGASSGNVVKTEAPQMNIQTNGLIDMVNTVLDLQQKKAATEQAKTSAENQVKEGLLLDSKISQTDWQNKILGVNFDDAVLNNAMLSLDRERHQYEFNYDFGRNVYQQYWYPTDRYVATEVEWPYDYDNNNNYFKTMRSLEKKLLANQVDTNWYNARRAGLAYTNESIYNADLLNYQRDIAKQQLENMKRSGNILQKDLDWYNWEHGFNMATNAIDSVTGLLFKGLDLGFSRLESQSRSRLNDARTWATYGRALAGYY